MYAILPDDWWRHYQVKLFFQSGEYLRLKAKLPRLDLPRLASNSKGTYCANSVRARLLRLLHVLVSTTLVYILLFKYYSHYLFYDIFQMFKSVGFKTLIKGSTVVYFIRLFRWTMVLRHHWILFFVLPHFWLKTTTDRQLQAPNLWTCGTKVSTRK